MADTVIREDFRFRRVGGGLLVFIALPLTLFWARFGLPLRYDFADFVFILGGPGMLLLGLWAAFPRRTPRVRLIISDKDVRVVTRRGDQVIALDDLVSVQWSYLKGVRQQRLKFRTAKTSVFFDVVHLTHEAQDIINLIAIRLENRGKRMREGRARITGAPDGIWTVSDGDPFEKDV
ncbi:hypothetical protein [Cognatiyoonia sp. IB215182]|uniref:hypothetical protein n=1 Tax=Cognatiyoonia sp. IB215182 TaxID=3097353 RepID=UPI002A0CA92B|nr:hypothetical protein [Cognatiyoonia sp. IB215182]MDX8350782.1 hypothetical protein [Cognatiyoonia sp. IB215182]